MQKRKTHNQTNVNGNTIIQNQWDAAKAVLREKVIAIQANLRKQKEFSNKQSNLTPRGTRKRRKNKTQSEQKLRNF